LIQQFIYVQNVTTLASVISDISMAPKIWNGSRDPDHVFFRGDFLSV